MKRTLFLSVLIIFFTTSMFIVGCNNQTPSKEQSQEDLKLKYELQEKCGKSGEEFLRKQFGGQGWYECHSNTEKRTSRNLHTAGFSV